MINVMENKPNRVAEEPSRCAVSQASTYYGSSFDEYEYEYEDQDGNGNGNGNGAFEEVVEEFEEEVFEFEGGDNDDGDDDDEEEEEEEEFVEEEEEESMVEFEEDYYYDDDDDDPIGLFDSIRSSLEAHKRELDSNSKSLSNSKSFIEEPCKFDCDSASKSKLPPGMSTSRRLSNISTYSEYTVDVDGDDKDNDGGDSEPVRRRRESGSVGDSTVEIAFESDEEYEEQVIEKWFGRDQEPDDLEAACRKLISIVYKDDKDVDPERMLRRSPLPELYKYLKQHYDYNVDHQDEDTPQKAEPAQKSLGDIFKLRLGNVPQQGAGGATNKNMNNSNDDSNSGGGKTKNATRSKGVASRIKALEAKSGKETGGAGTNTKTEQTKVPESVSLVDQDAISIIEEADGPIPRLAASRSYSFESVDEFASAGSEEIVFDEQTLDGRSTSTSRSQEQQQQRQRRPSTPDTIEEFVEQESDDEEEEEILEEEEVVEFSKRQSPLFEQVLYGRANFRESLCSVGSSFEEVIMDEEEVIIIDDEEEEEEEVVEEEEEVVVDSGSEPLGVRRRSF